MCDVFSEMNAQLPKSYPRFLLTRLRLTRACISLPIAALRQRRNGGKLAQSPRPAGAASTISGADMLVGSFHAAMMLPSDAIDAQPEDRLRV